MTFDEIMTINRAPFDENLLQNLFQNTLGFGRYPADVLMMILFLRYMEKFVEVYELNTSIPTLGYPYKNYILNDACDDSLETLVEYIYICEDIFGEFTLANGYSVYTFPTDPCEWPGEVNGNNEKETFENYINDLKNEWPQLSPIIEECREEINASGSYLEYGTMFILQNQEIGLFQEICKKYQNIVQSHLSAEKKAIELAIEDMEYPLFLGNVCKKGYCNGSYYICFDYGSNGYNYLDFSCLNWNWIITTFVLHKLIKDFRDKMKSLLCEDELEEAV